MSEMTTAEIARLHERELSQMKIGGPFLLALAGDIVGTYPIADLQEPAVQRVLGIIRNADVAFANMEANVTGGDPPSERDFSDIAADTKAQGFDMVLRAGDQSTTIGTERMLESNRIIADAGLVYAGSGRNLREARSPAYHMTSKGRVGMVGMHAYASPAHRVPGLNPMRLRHVILVPQDDLDAVRKIAVAHRDLAKMISASPLPQLEVDADPVSAVQLFNTTYALGERGRQQFTMDTDDERLNLRSVQDAKSAADFVIAAIRSHESAWTIPLDVLESEPPDFLVRLAREAIDNGADAFVSSGARVLRGIEIYKGRPIFYGLMSYWPRISVADHDDAMNTPSMESVVCEASFHDGKLAEIRICPIEFGYGLPMSQKGAPRLVTGEVAERILTRMQTLSKPLGTDMAIQDDIGIISVEA